jgi:hypothetical protein
VLNDYRKMLVASPTLPILCKAVTTKSRNIRINVLPSHEPFFAWARVNIRVFLVLLLRGLHSQLARQFIL